MRIKVLALSLISVTLVLSCPLIASSQQSKVIKFAFSDCKPAIAQRDGESKILSITIDAQNVLVEYDYQPKSYLFTADGFMQINHKFKTYSVQSYGELEARANSEVQKYTKIRRDIQIELTEETEIIHGFKVRKFIKRGDRRIEEVLWVSSDLIPVRLRTFGEKIRAIISADYWKKAPGIPKLETIIMLYGVPLKIVQGQTVCQAEIHEKTSSTFSFQVPATYRKVKAEF
jgi:hypothetical protein